MGEIEKKSIMIYIYIYITFLLKKALHHIRPNMAEHGIDLAIMHHEHPKNICNVCYHCNVYFAMQQINKCQNSNVKNVKIKMEGNETLFI